MSRVGDGVVVHVALPVLCRSVGGCVRAVEEDQGTVHAAIV